VIYFGGVCVPKLLLNLPLSLLLHHPLIDALTNGLYWMGRSMVSFVRPPLRSLTCQASSINCRCLLGVTYPVHGFLLGPVDAPFVCGAVQLLTHICVTQSHHPFVLIQPCMEVSPHFFDICLSTVLAPGAVHHT